MNGDVRTLLAEGERAERAGQLDAAYARYVTAGDIAAGGGSWRNAMRCFQRAIELDPFEREAVSRLAAIASQVHNRTEWSEYLTALDRKLVPRFAFRSVQLLIGNQGSFVTAPDAGPVLDVLLTGDDLLEAAPTAGFSDMPLAMALLVLRRALWTSPSHRARTPMSVRIAYNGRPHMKLHETGEWEPT